LPSDQLVDDGTILFGDVFKRLDGAGPYEQHGSRSDLCSAMSLTFRLGDLDCYAPRERE